MSNAVSRATLSALALAAMGGWPEIIAPRADNYGVYKPQRGVKGTPKKLKRKKKGNYFTFTKR